MVKNYQSGPRPLFDKRYIEARRKLKRIAKKTRKANIRVDRLRSGKNVY